jgi:hypothetical protein
VDGRDKPGHDGQHQVRGSCVTWRELIIRSGFATRIQLPPLQ